MIVWLCLRVAEPIEIMGVFANEVDAQAACSQLNDCIGPLTLGEKLPEDRREWPGAYYPLVSNGSD